MNFPGNAAVQRQTDGATTVVTEVTFERILPSPDGAEVIVEMDGELRYEPADPFAVTLTFVTLAGPVRWTLSRDVLLDGCYVPAGAGDVHVQPGLDHEGRSMVLLELSSPEGAATMTAPTAEVVAFSRRVLAAVPPGTESSHLDIDDVISRLLQRRVSPRPPCQTCPPIRPPPGPRQEDTAWHPAL